MEEEGGAENGSDMATQGIQSGYRKPKKYGLLIFSIL